MPRSLGSGNTKRISTGLRHVCIDKVPLKHKPSRRFMPSLHSTTTHTPSLPSPPRSTESHTLIPPTQIFLKIRRVKQHQTPPFVQHAQSTRLALCFLRWANPLPSGRQYLGPFGPPSRQCFFLSLFLLLPFDPFHPVPPDPAPPIVAVISLRTRLEHGRAPVFFLELCCGCQGGVEAAPESAREREGRGGRAMGVK